MKQQNRKKGTTAESIAADYLLKNSFEIVEKNYQNRFGEIDIIASKNDILCFVEVKAKTGIDFGSPEEMISKNKIKKIERMAQIYLLENKTKTLKFSGFRIDVIAIVLTSSREVERLNYYENIGADI